jgi:hypothetical protein
MNYKYIAYGYDDDGIETEDIEVHMPNLLNISHAVDKAKEDENAVIDGETGEPFVYQESVDTSWRLVSPKELAD